MQKRFNPFLVTIIYAFIMIYDPHTHTKILIWVFVPFLFSVTVSHNNHNSSSSSSSNNNKKYKDSCDDSSTLAAPGGRTPLSRSFSSPAVAYGKCD